MGDKAELQNGIPIASMNVLFGLEQKSPGFVRKR
jgi:hypothetical protein